MRGSFLYPTILIKSNCVRSVHQQHIGILNISEISWFFWGRAKMSKNWRRDVTLTKQFFLAFRWKSLQIYFHRYIYIIIDQVISIALVSQFFLPKKCGYCSTLECYKWCTFFPFVYLFFKYLFKWVIFFRTVQAFGNTFIIWLWHCRIAWNSQQVFEWPK